MRCFLRFFTPGKELTIRRPESNSPHALEKIAGYDNLIQTKAFPNRTEELSWVTDQIAVNINKDELMPEEIMVISLDWRKSKTDFFTMKQMLMQKGINAIRPGSDVATNVFQQKDNVTLTNIFPAKGNEASVVYVMGFEQVGSHPRLIVQERNQAFTAMTRTRGWCILTGVDGMAETLFDEIKMILANPERSLSEFPTPRLFRETLTI